MTSADASATRRAQTTTRRRKSDRPYRKLTPDPQHDVWLIMEADNHDAPTHRAERLIRRKQGPCLSVLFQWRSPVHKGQMRVYTWTFLVLYNVDLRVDDG